MKNKDGGSVKGLKIKPRKQEGKIWCGPTCVQMVLSHYNIRMSQRKIAKELRMIWDGVDIADLGKFFLNRGFDVTLKFWVRGIQPRWFGIDDPSELRKILKKKIPGNNNWNWYRTRLLKFVDAGGKLQLEPVWSNEIRSEIDEKRPVILNINPRVLAGYEQSDSGHYVVPVYMTGRESTDEMILFNDPWEGKKIRKPLERFMLSCHLWFGAGLFIKQKISPS